MSETGCLVILLHHLRVQPEERFPLPLPGIILPLLVNGIGLLLSLWSTGNNGDGDGDQQTGRLGVGDIRR